MCPTDIKLGEIEVGIRVGRILEVWATVKIRSFEARVGVENSISRILDVVDVVGVRVGKFLKAGVWVSYLDFVRSSHTNTQKNETL